MASAQNRAELDAKAGQGETVVSGGTGGKSLDAQERLAEEEGKRGKNRWDRRILWRKGGLSTAGKPGAERAEEEGIPIDESKYKTKP